jgi:hypothetical protein
MVNREGFAAQWSLRDFSTVDRSTSGHGTIDRSALGVRCDHGAARLDVALHCRLQSAPAGSPARARLSLRRLNFSVRSRRCWTVPIASIQSATMDELAKRTVSYYCDDDISIHCLCGPNPMRPLRVKLTNKLVEGYKLDQKMKMHRPRSLTYEELNMFHADGASSVARLSRLLSGPCADIAALGSQSQVSFDLFASLLASSSRWEVISGCAGTRCMPTVSMAPRQPWNLCDCFWSFVPPDHGTSSPAGGMILSRRQWTGSGCLNMIVTAVLPA